VDSPLAVETTEVFRKHAELYDREAEQSSIKARTPSFKRLRYIRDVGESKALNDLRGHSCDLGLGNVRSGQDPASSAQQHRGSSQHHSHHRLPGREHARRKLVDKLPEVAIFGEPMRLRAEVETINELSGHADQRELLEWIKPVASTLKRIFLVHGEPTQSAALAQAIHETLRNRSRLPAAARAST